MAAKAPSVPKTTKLRTTQRKEWRIAGYDEPFVQDPLTFFEKNDFLALVGRTIDTALDRGLNLDLQGLRTLFELSGDDLRSMLESGEADLDAVGDAASGLVTLVTRVFSLVPNALEELYLIALSVPPERWYAMRSAIRSIDDDTGFGILETFVEQNVTTMRDFLPRWLAQVRLLRTMMGSAGSSEPSNG